MTTDFENMVEEAKSKKILHWNYRNLNEIPEDVKHVANHVEEIYLKYNRLTSLPPWISYLSNLTNLYLSGNSIIELPKDLGCMTRLTVLDLSANQLNELPAVLGDLENLSILCLNQNCIRYLPNSLSRLQSLERLSLSGNKLSNLPEWLACLPNLKELLVDDNLLEELPNKLTVAPTLSIISVCSNRLTFLPLNGFVSSPTIRFDFNPKLNYLSLPLLYQLMSKIRNSNLDSANILASGCFDSAHRERERQTHLRLNLVTESSDNSRRITIELPRQLFAVYSIDENKTVSLWELALRQIYRSSFMHNLDVSFNSKNVKIERKKLEESQYALSDLPHLVSNYLVTNGPVSICVNYRCNEPIFTETWITFGVRRDDFSIPTIFLFCSQRCAARFVQSCTLTETHRLYIVAE